LFVRTQNTTQSQHPATATKNNNLSVGEDSTDMCYEEHKTYAGCHCEYKAWRKCDIAIAHDKAENKANQLAIQYGRPQDVQYTPSPCVKHVDYDWQNYTWPCFNCQSGKDPRKPGEVGEGKIMTDKVGKRVVDEWDGMKGTPENHA
jgi:hypothetical protein